VSRSTKEKKIIGWREWVTLPDLGVKKIKAKIDSGARTSSLHAFDLEFFSKKGKDFVRFEIHPLQKNDRRAVKTQAEVVEYRNIRSSNGQVSRRPVIITNIEMLGESWPIEITLSNRDEMSFRMLLGRESFRKKFLLDAGNSYFGEKKAKKLKAKAEGETLKPLKKKTKKKITKKSV
jgi:hypothetical protein